MSGVEKIAKLIHSYNAKSRSGFVSHLRKALPKHCVIGGRVPTKAELETVWNTNTSIAEMAEAIDKIAKVS